jgi:EAL domain-containing protein (putative c-di-GMP-specific phosphodiesterase class I)
MSPLEDLLAQEALSVHFQPILSLKKKAVLGLEALARPQGMNVGEMFKQATISGRMLEVDRLCRRKAMEDYKALVLPQDQRPLLFFNFEASLIDEGVLGSGVIASAVRKSGLLPSDVVIEINESKVLDIGALRQFVDHYRELGFLIALDDLGAGHSNLPRIAELRPHIIKLDRSLIQDIDRDYFKQETMKSLVALGHRVGCMVLAEGVETEAEVDTCANLGAELFQGFYFARPQSRQDLDLGALQAKLLDSARRQREKTVHAIQRRRLEGKRVHRLADAARNVLAQSDPTGFEIVLSRIMRAETSVECAYVLDKDGLQVTWTLTSSTSLRHQSRLFAPAPKGADHSNKEYFFSLLDAGLERYTTETYLSLATAKLCRTIAIVVPHKDGGTYVLCLDLAVDA